MKVRSPWSVVRSPWAVVVCCFVVTLTPLLAADKKEGQPPTTDHGLRTTDQDVQDFVVLTEKRPVLVRAHVSIDGKPFPAVWEQFVEYVFKSLDRNSDGVLSKDEAERTPPAQVLFGSGVLPGASYPTMEALDANKDGKVTLDELKAYYRREGVAPFQFQVQTGPRPRQGPIIVGQPAAPPSPRAVTDALFALLDTNKDGKLSKDELAAAPAVLLKLDLDDNEMITVPEIMAGVDTPPAAPARPPAAGPEPKPAAGSSPVVLVTPGEPPDNLVKQLLARYAKSGEGEKKKLTRQEIGLDEATFKRLDADGDGFLSAEELARFARRDPDVELTYRLGKNDKGKAVELVTSKDRPSPLAASLRAVKDSAVLDLGTTRLDLVAVARQENDQFATPFLRQFYKGQFAGADKGNKGYLDQKEAEGVQLFRGLFKVMDRDGDGKLTEKEVSAYLDQAQEYQTKARASCALLTYADQGNGLFDLLDTNRDGRLSVREMRQAVKLLETLDRDGDGKLSRDEVPRAFQLSLTQGGVGDNQLPARFAVAVRFNPGTPPPPAPTAGPLWFRKMDRNGDGDVSRREFLGTDEELAAIDTDGDGLISLEEAERYDAKVRKK